jgi:hypothetical protein
MSPDSEPSTDTLGDKLIGLRLLEDAGLNVPDTTVLTALPSLFPEGVDSVIFRPSLTTPFEPDAVEARSGEVDSLVVSRLDWRARRREVAALVGQHVVLMQPYIDHAAGAIAHYWPRKRRIQMAIAQKISDVAGGRDADVEGVLRLQTRVFITDQPTLTSSASTLIDAVGAAAPQLESLPPRDAWEFELCIDHAGRLWFLQAQPSTVSYDGWE